MAARAWKTGWFNLTRPTHHPSPPVATLARPLRRRHACYWDRRRYAARHLNEARGRGRGVVSLGAQGP
eukprot:6032867-Pyramimonas_sp.AAC.1